MIAPICPPPLKKGDNIAIIAPAGQLKDGELFKKGVKILQAMGFNVIFPEDLWPGTMYLADSDINRSHEFNTLFKNPEINGLISLRGGYGCLRMIDKIDLKQVLRTPKMVVGFSDITILQNYLFQNTGLISMHGPVLTSLTHSTESTLKRYFQCLSGNWAKEISVPQIEILKKGSSIAAPLMGGNLSSLVTLLGTRYDFEWHEKIVYIEDINEPLYRIDRMLTQLKLADKFHDISGLIIGDFSCDSLVDEGEKHQYLVSVWDIIIEICENENFPVWGNFPAGHRTQNLTLPLGSFAEMKSEKRKLLFS